MPYSRMAFVGHLSTWYEHIAVGRIARTAARRPCDGLVAGVIVY